mmetsp:Transcript_6645/g.16756  ORF Transcript_6645/g.16756 Transcript_6645/m.16756 type:complete len:179 (-) Transcript_6645:94-630(-)|eukprot:CAMPEP_0113476296 /NCGR_PEP_ID=MMETSP0014_2-20120614/19586_1 /TAXON_ID=2857 /ORGANISM="Nitzschia sp." /LENGTH=178 /DNA_ID=CAMNT_0000369289 /DNA_START=508 /DNA_END=1044 /DNA_ORIENTATION=- /assembly_acc=CAM_ASM_000159
MPPSRLKFSTLKPSNQKVLDAIATVQFRIPGSTFVPRQQLKALCTALGITGTSTFLNALTDLKNLKLIQVSNRGANIELTDEGSELANTDETLSATNTWFHEMKKREAKLTKPGELAVFDLLKDRQIHSKDEIFKASEYNAMNSTFAGLLTKLKKAKIIKPEGKRGYKMPDTMFPFPN